MNTPHKPAKQLNYFIIVGVLGIGLPLSARATHQQWNCQPAGGEWRCEAQTASDHHYIAKPIAANHPQAATDSTVQWDWVPKEQLADPALCKTGCDGAYVAPEPDWPDSDQNPERSPLRASAGSSRLVENTVSLNGDVSVSQGHRRLSAERASLDRTTDTLTAEGHIEYREPGLLVAAERTEMDLNSGLGQFEQARFLNHEKSLRGFAETIARPSDNTLRLEQSTVTLCPPQAETWSLAASRIDLDNGDGWGSARHARLNIHDVPVVYVPYMTFPIDDRRKTGFLWPSFSNGSSGGFEFTTPYYLNLAPNYDATIAPRFIEERGTMAQVELRHLSSLGQWQASGAWLEDDMYREGIDAEQALLEDRPERRKRWTGNIEHQGGYNGFSTRIDYSKVSDKDFFRHLNTDSLELRRSAHLLQQASIAYGAGQWHTGLLIQRYQTIDDQLTKQYQMAPRFTLERSYRGANFALDWMVDTEYTRFDHDQSWDEGGTFTTGERAFGEAGISYPMRWTSGFIIPTAKMRTIRYDLDATASGQEQILSTTSPLGSLDMGLVFERSGSDYLQTLEPRAYYLYSDYDPQNSHPNFDTRELNFSYAQLFRDSRFAGHDRLNDANQASIGITSRFIENARGLEVLTLSLGQLFYFDDRRVQVDAAIPDASASNSLIAEEIQYQPHPDLWLSQTVLWNSHNDRIQEGGVGVHYQSAGDSLYNLDYRFRRNGSRTLDDRYRDISQVDASVVLPLSERWDLYARYRYDAEINRAVDDLLGVRYEDCCWAVSLVYQRSIDLEYQNESTGQTVVERDHLFVLEFQLKGLGSLGDKVRNMLTENILGYEDLDQ